MTNLFNAYFRVRFSPGGEIALGTALPLDLPTLGKSRYHFVARFAHGSGWEVDAGIHRPDLDIQFANMRSGFVANAKAAW
jgi:hypothetical protein